MNLILIKMKNPFLTFFTKKTIKTLPKHPLSIMGLFLLLLFACELPTDNANQNTPQNTVTNRVLLELNYLDNGAVIPFPQKRRVRLVFPDTNSVNLIVSNFNANEPEIAGAEKPVKGAEIDDLLTQIDRLELKSADGMDVKMGKTPCLGKRNLDVSLIYSTGDTVRYAVLGEARCDPSLYPNLWAIDSIVQIIMDKK